MTLLSCHIILGIYRLDNVTILQLLLPILLLQLLSILLQKVFIFENYTEIFKYINRVRVVENDDLASMSPGPLSEKNEVVANATHVFTFFFFFKFTLFYYHLNRLLEQSVSKNMVLFS